MGKASSSNAQVHSSLLVGNRRRGLEDFQATRIITSSTIYDISLYSTNMFNVRPGKSKSKGSPHDGAPTIFMLRYMTILCFHNAHYDDIYAVSLCSTGRGCYRQVIFKLYRFYVILYTLATLFWLLYASLLFTLDTLIPQSPQSSRRSHTELLYLMCCNHVSLL